jgi:Fe-S-cluster containining protein
MNCNRCGACCIAPSITTPIPNMPQGKPAGTRCANLNERNACSLYGRPERPAFCTGWQPTPEICSTGFVAALENIAALERDSC